MHRFVEVFPGNNDTFTWGESFDFQTAVWKGSQHLLDSWNVVWNVQVVPLVLLPVKRMSKLLIVVNAEGKFFAVHFEDFGQSSRFSFNKSFACANHISLNFSQVNFHLAIVLLKLHNRRIYIFWLLVMALILFGNGSLNFLNILISLSLILIITVTAVLQFPAILLCLINSGQNFPLSGIVEVLIELFN